MVPTAPRPTNKSLCHYINKVLTQYMVCKCQLCLGLCNLCSWLKREAGRERLTQYCQPRRPQGRQPGSHLSPCWEPSGCFVTNDKGLASAGGFAWKHWAARTKVAGTPATGGSGFLPAPRYLLGLTVELTARQHWRPQEEGFVD